MAIDDFLIDGIRQNVTESLECSEVFNSFGSKMFYVKDTELFRSEGSGVASATYCFGNLVCCKCQC